jgi:gliding motility-associated lipoprotein GldH
MKIKTGTGITDKEETTGEMKTVNKILLLFPFVFAACVNINVFEKNQVVEGASWPSGKIFRFEYSSSDTLNPKDIFINLRHTGLYKYNNIFMFVTTIAPNSQSQKDTIEFTIADNKGKWIGSGIGDIHDVRLVYRRNIRFGQTGNYVFYIQHGMRETELKEITDVGIRIEESKKE